MTTSPPVTEALCTLYETLSTILPSGRYTTTEWVSGYNRCWRMFVREIKKALLVHWETDEGSSIGVSPTGLIGIGQVVQVYQRLSDLHEDYGQAGVLHAETRDHTHQFQQSGEDATDGSAASVVNPDVIWRETALVLYKNHVHGWGHSSPVASAPPY
ncbi:hypothetical protein Ahy_A06g027396 isoform A [Arachis hypogaea]|uniref:Uncharacterized protein n=1 Tax=Arachis hypogaea TaxID=3818 RepID=A0A445CNK7_ARAHY|nr:hypothetical protein Ahy_A06g027396 isoform A [Arachis hypogaea]